jgi:hypothetical protein
MKFKKYSKFEVMEKFDYLPLKKKCSENFFKNDLWKK